MNQDEDRLIQVVHYHNHPSEFHSIPFRFVAIKGEPFEETKKRLQRRTGLGDMDWKKVKFTVLRNLHAPEPLVTVIDNPAEFELRKARLQEEDALGLDHIDKSSKGRFSSVFEKGIFIRGWKKKKKSIAQTHTLTLIHTFTHSHSQSQLHSHWHTHLHTHIS